eukprot:619645-Amphidinium_carterae.1
MERRTQGIPNHRLHEGCGFVTPLWTQITKCAITQQGPALVFGLRGETREIVCDLDAGELVNGKVDPLT